MIQKRYWNKSFQEWPWVMNFLPKDKEPVCNKGCQETNTVNDNGVEVRGSFPVIVLILGPSRTQLHASTFGLFSLVVIPLFFLLFILTTQL